MKIKQPTYTVRRELSDEDIKVITVPVIYIDIDKPDENESLHLALDNVVNKHKTRYTSRFRGGLVFNNDYTSTCP